MELNHGSDCKSDDQSGSLPCTSQHGEPNSNWMAPGRVVWAKTSDEKWWPAEVCSDSFFVKTVILFQYKMPTMHLYMLFMLLSFRSWKKENQSHPGVITLSVDAS